MNEIYRHRQIGLVTVVAVGTALVIIAVNWIRLADVDPAARIILSSVGVLMLFIMYLFGSLTVAVDSQDVRFWFGPGLIRKRFPVDRILEAKPVRNPWWFGWGIRVIPGGWLYNVSGLDAVQLVMGDGRKVRIGTDEPDRLMAAIAEARNYHR